jgi:hypothetical protein
MDPSRGSALAADYVPLILDDLSFRQVKQRVGTRSPLSPPEVMPEQLTHSQNRSNLCMICDKGLTHKNMETEKSPDLPYASWNPEKAKGGGRRENPRAGKVSSNPSLKDGQLGALREADSWLAQWPGPG